MPFPRAGRISCGGLLVRVLSTLVLCVVGLVCWADRSWFEARAATAVYGDASRIHSGAAFRPGASAVEDGVRQTALLVGGAARVRAIAPTPLWRDHHRDAVCEREVCTATATPRGLRAGPALGSLLGVVLLGVMAWFVLSSGSPAAGRGR